MSATTNDLTTAPSRTPLLAALGIAAAAVLTAVGTFWDVNNNDAENAQASDWLVCLGIIAVTAAIAYGLVVRGAEAGNPGRRSAVLGVVAFLSNAVFWAGLPMVLASAAAACAFVEKDERGTFGTASKAGLVLAVLTAVPAVSLALFG
jgi:predicted membrane protein